MDTLETYIKRLELGKLGNLRGAEIIVGGKLIGIVQDYNSLTSTITFKEYSWLRKIWGWIKAKLT